MPRSSIFHRNRSQASLSTQDANARRSYQATSPVDSPLHSPGLPRPSVASTLGPDEDGDRYYQPYHPEEARGPGGVQRSQSQRVHQPTIHLVHSPTHGSTEPPVFDDNPDSYYQQQPTPASYKEEPKRRGLFSLRNSSIAKEPANNANTNRIGRSKSVRKTAPTPGFSAGSTPATFLPSSRDEEAVEGGEKFDASHLQPGPPPPEKDPRLHQSQLSNQTEHPYNRPPPQGVLTDSFYRQPLERQGSSTSSAWESTVPQTQQQQQYCTPPEQSQQQPTHQPSLSSATSLSNHPLYQQPTSYQPSPSSATSTSSHPLQSRAPQGTLQQLYSEKKSSRPSSLQSLGPPSPLHSASRATDNYQPRSGANSAVPTQYIQSPMGPPPPQHQQPPNRRSDELVPQQQPIGLNRESSGYQAYHQGPQSQSQQSGAPPQHNSQLGVNNSQGNNLRGPPQSSPMAPQNTSDQGRSTPPPSRSRDDLAGLDITQLLQRHDELQDKYRKVKKYYFEKDAQVQQLQNTLAHQRLSLSRTSLDDNEYSNRFQRLDGAINNLAFNFRRDWRSVPPWLAPQVNKEATTTQSKEMTAVGRACISRWLVDEIFDRYFHPSLDPNFSAHLKSIEKNLRRLAPLTPSDEEKEGLIAKISNWRLATLDGLAEMLASAQAAEYRATLTESLQERLKASLAMNLKQPPPAELEGVDSIIELAVGIAANLPLESRDVFVEYIMPGVTVNEAYMKIETGLPVLMNPGSSEGHDNSDKSSEEITLEASTKDSASEETAVVEDRGQQQQQQQQQLSRPGSVTAGKEAAAANKKKGGMFGGFIGGKKAGAVAGGSGPAASQAPQQQRMEDKVRFATFMAVEVRGRSVLVKAPVYTFKAPSN